MDKVVVRNFIIEKTRQQIKLLGIESIALDDSTDVVREGLFDSLSFIDLISECEQEFKTEIQLEHHDPREFTQVGKLTEIIFHSIQK
jgi:acyl carrier protein